jgi:hypothetical protein
LVARVAGLGIVDVIDHDTEPLTYDPASHPTPLGSVMFAGRKKSNSAPA